MDPIASYDVGKALSEGSVERFSFLIITVACDSAPTVIRRCADHPAGNSRDYRSDS
jgi:hypothetical protein